MAPQILIVGHIVKDITSSGWRPGGSVFYAAAQARRLGLEVAAVTACAGDIDPTALLPDIGWRVVPSDATTTFENRYVDGARRQRILAVGRALTLADVPQEWRGAPLILLAPLFHDVDAALPSQIARAGAVVGLGAQGWLRRLEGETVHAGRVDAEAPWLAGDAVFVSDEDVEDAEAVSIWRKRVPIVVLTRARSGCTVWSDAGRFDLPAYALAEVDPTGAGDVFAAAFLVRYRETRDVRVAARFANAAAALSVRGEGLSAITVRQEIDALLYRRPVVRT
jgi:sugar/nucleoside kinase (ribokinase family)